MFLLVAPLLAGSATPPTPSATNVSEFLLKKVYPPRPPNIVLIVADDLGYGDLGCYGQDKIQTPNIDRLAAEGMRFTQCYAGSGISVPSRACLMTGHHTGHGGIRGPGDVPLKAEDVTVASLLKRVGYQTGVIGLWGLGATNSTGTPHLQGFDEWLGFHTPQEGENYYPPFLWRSSVQQERYDHALVLDANLHGQRQVYVQEYFTMAASNYVRISRFQPFFLYLAFTIPQANRARFKTTGNGMEVPDDQPYSNQSWPQPEKNKAAMITRLDQSVGSVLDQLARFKLDTNTVVFFTSDNGPHPDGGIDPDFFNSNGPWRGVKGSLYEGGLRVPMIVRWPGKIAPGTVSDQLWAFWDFLPTAAALAETQAPPEVDGLSILPTLLGAVQTNQHDYLYWELPHNGFHQAIRSGDWKAIRNNPDQPWELYNLRMDPAETNNLALQRTELLRRMEGLLKTARCE